MTMKLSKAALNSSTNLSAVCKTIKGLAPFHSKVRSLEYIDTNLKVTFDYIPTSTSDVLGLIPPFIVGSTITLVGFGTVEGSTETFNGSYTVVSSTPTTAVLSSASMPSGEFPLDLGYINSKFKLITPCTLTMNRTSTVTINFDTLEIPWSPNETYTFEIEDGFVTADNRSTFTSIPVSVAFTTNSPPTPISSVPASGSSGNYGGTLILNYGRTIFKNSGQIHLYKTGSPDVLVKSFNITDSEVTLSNNNSSITISLLGYYTFNTTFYVLIDEGIVKDYDNFISSAVSNTSLVRFTTMVEPSDPLLDPGNIKRIGLWAFWTGDPRVYLILPDPPAGPFNPRATKANVTDNTKGLLLKNETDNNNIRTFYHTKTAQAGADASASGYESAITGNAIYFYPRTFLVRNKTYSITCQDGAYYELSTGFNINQETFTFDTNVGIYNATGITYFSNQNNQLFPTLTAPEAYKAKLLDKTAVHTMQITSPIGQFLATGIPLTSTLTYSGTRDQISALLPSIYFRPNSGVTSNSNYTVTFTHPVDGVIGSQTISLTYGG